MAPLVLAPWLLAAVLVAGAVGKLLDDASARAAFVRLKVPSALSRPWMQRALPWGEFALAAGLLVVPGPWRVLVASAALALFLAYTWLVWRAWRSGEETDCHCFGTFTSGRVTGWTVTRNLSLVVASLVALADAVRPAPPALRALQPDAVAWVLGAAAVAWVVLTIVHEPARPEGPEAGGLGFGTSATGSSAAAAAAGSTGSAAPAGAGEVPGEVGEYVRLPIPYGEVEGIDGDRHQLRHLARERAVLLVWLSLGCGSCQRIIDELPGWSRRLGVVDVRPVFYGAAGVAERMPGLAHRALLDEGGRVQQVFDASGTPMAVLLGVDGLLAGGPVVGSGAVEGLVEDMLSQLEEAGLDEEPLVAMSEPPAAP